MPKLPGSVTVVPGPFQIGWFRTLNPSARNSTLLVSRIRNRLKSDASNARVPGARKSGDVREVLPNVKLPACENTDWSKYESSRSSVGPSFFADLPLLFGRCPGEPSCELL